MNYIARNLDALRERIAGAAQASGRDPEDVFLLAISKTFPVEFVAQAAEGGQHRFGENRIQEAEGKIPLLHALPNLEWHLVGHLQSNKARRAAELFDVIHSLDSVRLAARLDQACRELGKRISVLVQVDLGGEATKYGATPDEAADLTKSLAAFPSLQLDGLMTIPPFLEDPEQIRPYFQKLRALRDALEAEYPGCLGKKHLSMGMSHDFEVAISEGATIVRIGTALFGSRQ